MAPTASQRRRVQPFRTASGWGRAEPDSTASSAACTSLARRYRCPVSFRKQCTMTARSSAGTLAGSGGAAWLLAGAARASGWARWERLIAAYAALSAPLCSLVVSAARHSWVVPSVMAETTRLLWAWSTALGAPVVPEVK